MITESLYVTERGAWRRWLIRNHESKKEIWLIYYKKHTGKPSIPYENSVEEALCFGWIDSTIKKIDEEKFARKFTPRKNKSRWSQTNKKRARMMIRNGKMLKEGMAKIKQAKKSGEWFQKATIKKEISVPTFMKKKLVKNKKALDNFNNLAISYRRQYVSWITSAKRLETRERRLKQALRLLEKNQKLGMK